MPEFQMNTAGKIPVTFSDLDIFTRAYVTCMFWTNEDELPERASFGELAPESLCAIIQDCASFQRVNAGNLRGAYGLKPEYDEAAAGHDFWLTRCGHGAGFWDRELGLTGDELTEACRHMSIDVYLGDDGLIYLT